MALADVRIVDTGGYVNVPTRQFQTDAAVAAINPGEPVKLTADGSPYVIVLADAEPVISTTTPIVGIAASADTVTATVDGKVSVYLALPGIVYGCKATTTTNVNTQAKIDALVNDNVGFDLTTTTFTVDENQGTGLSGGLVITGGDPSTFEVFFFIRSACTQLGEIQIA